MRGAAMRALFTVVVAIAAGGYIGAQETLDRIVARVENDIILLSDVQALSRYQQLVEGKSEVPRQILDRLIDQWIVQTEAEVARFPHPSDADIDRGLSRLQKSFVSTEEYEARKKEIGLDDSETVES
jgi:hypothetical protein